LAEWNLCWGDSYTVAPGWKCNFHPNRTIICLFCGINLSGERFLIVDGNDSNLTGSLEPELLGRLLDRHAATLELYARQLCNCPEDVVQEAFVELARQPGVPVDLMPWLYRVVRNKAISASRAIRRHKVHESQAAGRHRAWFEPSPGDALDAATAMMVLENLPPIDREVVIARIWGGLTFQQIGELIGATDSTAHRHYESALVAIRQKLRASCLKKD
jgi:RNA polymerase sigma factor (sigma-70 family)